MSYDINYDDERFTKVESEKSAALSDLEKTYGGMISDSDKFYQDQIDASKDWADKQSQIQQEQTDFAIEKIEQQKDQTKKDYLKEQSGAYVDWQKQSNQYGVESERQAAVGMDGTGFSESSQVSMHNQYQNRVATARESYNNAVLNYNNAIKDARLQNNAALAQIAADALQQQLELALEGFQYKNTLLLDKANKKTELENQYYNRYQDVLKQINTENALAEEIRQYNESMAEEKRQFNESMAFDREQFEYQKAKASGGGGGGGGSSSAARKAVQSAAKAVGAKIDKGDGNTGKTDNASTMKSIINLGYGPISATTLDGLVKSGQVKEYTDDGVTKFKKATVPVKKNSTFLSGRSLFGK